MSAVFTIGETDFDDLDDEEFLNEAFNFESEQLTNSISSNNVETCSPTSNIGDKGPDKTSNGYSNKHNLLRSKGSSVNTFLNSGSSAGCLRPSSINSGRPNNEHANAKRIGNFNDNFSSEPPLKKQNCVMENRIPSLGNDQLFNSTGITRNNTSEHTMGTDKMLAESKSSSNDISINKAFDFNPVVRSRATSNLSNGLRYTQNTTSAVSSPRLTNDRPGSLAGPSTPLRKNALCDQRRPPATNSFTPNTPNRYNERDASQDLLRSTISPSVSKQSNHLRGTGGSEVRHDSLSTHNRTHDSNPPITPNRYKERDSSQNLLRSTISPSFSEQTPEFRITNDSSNHLRGTGRSEIRNDSLSTHNRTNSNPPVTPNRYTQRDSSVDKRRNKVSTSANSHTPKQRGFAKESPVLGNLRTPTAERRCFTPRRFPGPAGILPRLDPGQSLDNLQSPSSETPTKKSPQLCQLVTGDSDEDFTIEPWTLMQEKISKDFPDSLDSLASVVRKAASHQLERGKVAFLAVLVKSFHPTGIDVSIVLKDPSGEMRGTLHRKVLEQQQIELGPGCGLFLKQVSVFSPSPRKHYLNITPGNILEIFPASAERCSSQKIAEAIPKSGPKEMGKQAVCSTSSKETEQAQSFEETNFNELLEGLDDDDDMLVEAMNF